MPQVKRLREVLTGGLDMEYLQNMRAAGWRLSAVEWERDVESSQTKPRLEDPPYGLQVASDCRHLEENSREQQALSLILESVARDQQLSEIAAELNRRGFRTRVGAQWGVADVFRMLPRVIDAGPHILASR